MYSTKRSHGWESPEPFTDSEDEYGGTHGIVQDIGAGGHWISNEALSVDSNMYIDPTMLDNPGDSISAGYADVDFETAQNYSETDSSL
ncbi:hypothetical protein PG994_008547 [Apiospora phragmitis]|uniref:Uncharacterized protein n=1 Tax=Apiospora phragmitis TaxID=2905665 RepID=A0ABR1UJT4_9PEZI